MLELNFTEPRSKFTGTIFPTFDATNPTAEGEATASYLIQALGGRGITISRIALGVPMGGDLKYMDSMTLQHSIKSRISITP